MSDYERARRTDRKLDPGDPFRGNGNVFRFTEPQRQALAERVMLQKPPDEAAFVTFQELLRRRKTIEGIPVDVLFTLEAIRELAEQGNRVAERLYWAERIRLGIDVPKRVHLG